MKENVSGVFSEHSVL